MSTTVAEAAYRRMSEADLIEYYGETSQDEVDAYEEQRELDAAGPRFERRTDTEPCAPAYTGGGFGDGFHDIDPLIEAMF